MQRKVSALLAIADFASLQLDQFLQILSVLEQVPPSTAPPPHRAKSEERREIGGRGMLTCTGLNCVQFAEIGDSFSQSTSHGLLASIKKQSKEFFLREHKRRLEDLPTILEAETWIRMPVNPSFGALGTHTPKFVSAVCVHVSRACVPHAHANVPLARPQGIQRIHEQERRRG
jgi:hypothetical protein